LSGKESADSLEMLIAIEWDIIRELQGKLDSECSASEMAKISNALAYHVNTLNKLLARREEPMDEEPLERVIVSFPRRFSRVVAGRIRRWIRGRSSTG